MKMTRKHPVFGFRFSHERSGKQSHSLKIKYRKLNTGF